MMGCVYVIHALTTPYYKIGKTKNIKSRVHGLRRTVPFFDLDVVAIHFHEKYEEIERRLHAMFTDKRLKNTEWFELSEDDLSTVLMRTIDLVDSMGFVNRKVDLHELFPSPQESAARLEKIRGDVLFRITEILKEQARLWRHHEDCEPLSQEGCVCGLWDARSGYANALDGKDVLVRLHYLE